MAAISLTTVFLFLLAVVVLVTVYLLLSFRRGREKLHFFDQIVWTRKGKEMWDTMCLPRKDVDQLTDSQIEKLVVRYLSPAGQAEGPGKLLQLGERAIPSLVKALADPSYRNRPTGKDVSMFTKSGAEVALSALGRSEHPEILPILELLATHEESQIRYSAAVHLGKFPNARTLPLISDLMGDADDHVRSGVCIGLMHAIKEKRVPPDIRQVLVKLLASQIIGEPDNVIGEIHPAALLLNLDPKAAATLLTTAEVLSPTNPAAPLVINLLSQKGIPIPAAQLKELLETADRTPLDHATAKLRGELLKAMASMGHPDAESRILHTLASKVSPEDNPQLVKPFETLEELAGEAFCIMLGIRDPIDLSYDLAEAAHNNGREVPPAVRNVRVVAELDAEVCNGGFSQYFFNSSGNDAVVAASALHEINAPQHATIAQAACGLFGSDGPSKDRELRHRQLEAMNEIQRQRMGTLDSEWYAAEARLGHLLHLYSAANSIAFSTARNGCSG